MTVRGKNRRGEQVRTRPSVAGILWSLEKLYLSKVVGEWVLLISLESDILVGTSRPEVVAFLVCLWRT